MKKMLSIFTVGLIAGLVHGCSDSKEVGVSGVVYNIDTFQAVSGIKVYFYGETDPLYATTTDANGAFSFAAVPVGKKFVLVTDDVDSSTDDWAKTANVEVFQATVGEEAISNYRIHACPSTKSWAAASTLDADLAVSSGTVDVWNSYLASSDNTLAPEVTSFAASGGVVSMSVFEAPLRTAPLSVDCAPFTAGTLGALTSTETVANPLSGDIKVTGDFESSFGAIGMLDATSFNNPCYISGATVQDPGLLAFSTANLATPFIDASATADKTLSGKNNVVIFGKPDTTSTSITLNLENTQSTGRTVVDFPLSVEVPVEDAMISLILWGLQDTDSDGTYEAVNFDTVLCTINPSAPGC